MFSYSPHRPKLYFTFYPTLRRLASRPVQMLSSNSLSRRSSRTTTFASSVASSRLRSSAAPRKLELRLYPASHPPSPFLKMVFRTVPFSCIHYATYLIATLHASITTALRTYVLILAIVLLFARNHPLSFVIPRIFFLFMGFFCRYI